jgi:murein DD-endopeptidase MepM/ murein hydrolase activator NlpD
MKILAIALSPLVALLALLLGVVVVLGQDSPTTPSAAVTTCLPSLPDSVSDVSLTADQWRSAREIVAVGRSKEVPVRGWVIAVATALQESSLRPLPYGDRDSLGMFQQRAAWGTTDARMDPATAAAMFYTGGTAGQPGLLDIPSWSTLPLSEAAQAVQRSAFPDAYARWEPLAQRIVARVAGEEVSCAEPGNWISPLREGSYAITATYGQCGSHWSSCHTGLDFAAPRGTPAMAATDGAVTFSGIDGPYGHVVRILGADSVAIWYAHLDQRLVGQGSRVRAGDVVGLIGETGNSTGPHLHFEVRLNATAAETGTPTDPHTWLRQQRALP